MVTKMGTILPPLVMTSCTGSTSHQPSDAANAAGAVSAVAVVAAAVAKVVRRAVRRRMAVKSFPRGCSAQLFAGGDVSRMTASPA